MQTTCRFKTEIKFCVGVRIGAWILRTSRPLETLHRTLLSKLAIIKTLSVQNKIRNISTHTHTHLHVLAWSRSQSITHPQKKNMIQRLRLGIIKSWLVAETEYFKSKPCEQTNYQTGEHWSGRAGCSRWGFGWCFFLLCSVASCDECQRFVPGTAFSISWHPAAGFFHYHHCHPTL